ncbi:type IV toxin-antitoxin system AbiEi family antitoxin domain-containing protein [Mycobacterium kyogaense]|uniref:type IV toxin-antitoxin system AbiEi family antitoxin domain-containing protein n=1 Tax=Mycobacterium kyogaense TaxID=2212479 RepID=UPI000DACE7F4|nr:type IV toxin-antitoxin system AbiEi family antitoxin [Mycobacterium kyogaense]
MARQHTTAVPASLAARPLRTLRTGQADDTYAYPGPEIARLHEQGLLHRLAHGYYVVIPQELLERRWMPDLEAAAAGIATTIYGHDDIVVMGLSAARLYGAIPRALATAIVAVPRQHRPIALTDRPAVVRFVQRDTSGLDAERIRTELGPVLATTPEQTVLDLAHRPTLGHSEADVPTAVAALYRRSDKQRLEDLAREQRRVASLRRAEEWAGIDRGS